MEDILSHRLVGNPRRRTMEYLIKWRHFPVYEASWEPEISLENAKDILDAYKYSVGL